MPTFRPWRLVLHVEFWTPRTTPPARLSVLVWIHGGSFTLGSGGDQYDGQELANDGRAVIITVNYRLGALGLIAHEKLTAEGGTSGNYGIMDQRAALAWARRDVSAFGGDPDNVTVFGESAGDEFTFDKTTGSQPIAPAQCEFWGRGRRRSLTSELAQRGRGVDGRPPPRRPSRPRGGGPPPRRF